MAQPEGRPVPTRLKVDKRFQPCPAGPGDEIYPNGVFEKIARAFLRELGEERLRGLSVDYDQGDWLEKVVTQTFERLKELRAADPDNERALAGFSEDNTVKIMTIHKSKGLEFDTVAILGLERETLIERVRDLSLRDLNIGR